ncbi:unnamed protein product, partial [Polarella glacialis]
VIKTDPALQTWTRMRSGCQRTCMTHVLSWSLQTQWAVGQLLAPGGGNLFCKSLADSVRACYPGFRAERADEVATKVSHLVTLSLKKSLPEAAASGEFVGRSLQARASSIPACLQHVDSEDDDREQFLVRLEQAVDSAVSEAQSRSWSLSEHASRPCQRHCRRAVVRQAAETVWDTGLLSRGNADVLTMTALEGALSACLPALPSGSAEGLAGQALINLQNSHPSSVAAPARALLRDVSRG